MGKHAGLTRQIIGAFYQVYNTLGYGFLEKIYENSMVLELQNLDLKPTHQQPIIVYYNGVEIGQYIADIVANDSVLLELKATRQLTSDHEAQLLNYLKATKMEVGLLLNFGQKAEGKRKILDNEHKGSLTWTTKQ